MIVLTLISSNALPLRFRLSSRTWKERPRCTKRSDGILNLTAHFWPQRQQLHQPQLKAQHFYLFVLFSCHCQTEFNQLSMSSGNFPRLQKLLGHLVHKVHALCWVHLWYSNAGLCSIECNYRICSWPNIGIMDFFVDMVSAQAPLPFLLLSNKRLMGCRLHPNRPADWRGGHLRLWTW